MKPASLLQFDKQEEALIALGRALRDSGYRFVTPTPATHAIVNARKDGAHAKSLTDVFGWSRPFEVGLLPDRISGLVTTGGVLEKMGSAARATVRFSSLDGLLFMHSAFPTAQSDAVFFGPDTYRFARVLKGAVRGLHAQTMRLIDIGCGSGAGGIYLASLLKDHCDVDLVLGDINPQALRFARINAALNEYRATVVQSDVLCAIEGTADLIVANPPYLVDGRKRAYRHGGGNYGSALSVRIVEESVPRLVRGGQLVLYTGSAIVDGVDTFRRDLHPLLARFAYPYTYEEIDPDVFGDELLEGPYQNADRIAVVALTVRNE